MKCGTGRCQKASAFCTTAIHLLASGPIIFGGGRKPTTSEIWTPKGADDATTHSPPNILTGKEKVMSGLTTWKDIGGIAYEIIEGKHDDELDYISQACKQRLKQRFRVGGRYVLQGTKNVALDGQTVTIIKVNQKSISVGVGEVETLYGRPYYPAGEYNVPAHMLAPV
jgi:hypothetical protein